MERARSQAEVFLRFLFVGITATIVALAVRAFLYLFINFELSVALGHIAGMIVAFYLNIALVFAFSGRLWPAFLRFAAVNAVSLAIAVVVSSLVYRWVFPAIGRVPLPDLAAHFIGCAAATLPSFIFHSKFSFRPE